jgi:hypothetical protein
MVAVSCSILLLVPPENISAASAFSAAVATGKPTWTVRAVPRGVDTLIDVVCPTASHCYAVGEEGTTGPDLIIGSADGGDHWHSLMTAPEGVQLVAIACPTPSNCVVAGGINPSSTTEQPAVEGNPPLPTPATLEAFLTTDDGARWSSVTIPKGIFGVDDAACASAEVCLVIGSVGIDRTTNSGTTWVMEKMPSRFSLLGPVACPTRSFCIVGGTGGHTSSGVAASVASVSQDAGATWSKGIVVAGPVHSKEGSISSTTLGALSCSSAQRCVGLFRDGSLSAIGTGSPIVTSDAGSTWTRGSRSVGAVDSCVANFCVSVGGHLRPFAGSAFVTTARSVGPNPPTGAI